MSSYVFVFPGLKVLGLVVFHLPVFRKNRQVFFGSHLLPRAGYPQPPHAVLFTVPPGCGESRLESGASSPVPT